mgnify:CR=1 FL=1
MDIMLSKESEDDMVKKNQQKTESEAELLKQIQKLQKQNMKLLIENEYLKKLDALISEREKREQKK